MVYGFRVYRDSWSWYLLVAGLDVRCGLGTRKKVVHGDRTTRGSMHTVRSEGSNTSSLQVG